MTALLNPTPKRSMIRKIKHLYRKSFPKEERKPFSVIRKKQAEGSVEILSAESWRKDLLGFAITAKYKDLVLVDYLAVTPQCQGQGIGSQILTELKAYYPDKRIILEIEDPAEPCENGSDRIRRKAFYEKNGFTQAGFTVWLFGVKMPVLICGGSVEYEEYHQLYDTVFSPEIAKNITKA